MKIVFCILWNEFYMVGFNLISMYFKFECCGRSGSGGILIIFVLFVWKKCWFGICVEYCSFYKIVLLLIEVELLLFEFWKEDFFFYLC